MSPDRPTERSTVWCLILRTVIAAADITIVNDTTGVQYAGKTNNEGIYVVTNLPPGPYRMQVAKIGFKTLIKPDIVLSVQDSLAINFTLPIGAVSETVTIEGGAAMIDTQDGTVSTVVDRQFADNLPMNGRSFQTLITLAPGVTAVPGAVTGAQGEFSVNGNAPKRTTSPWMESPRTPGRSLSMRVTLPELQA